jgi:hypothetical protein
MLDWRQALRSSGLALVVAIFVILLGLPAGLGMLAAGLLSVVLYRRRCPLTRLTAGMGARLGALTGGLGFGVFAIMLALWTAVRSGREIHDALLKIIQQYAAHGPETQQVLDLFNTPEGFTVIMILTLVMILAAFLIFSSLGGALGAFLPRRKDRL